MDKDEHYDYLKQIANDIDTIILNDVGKTRFQEQIEDFKKKDESRLTQGQKFARTRPTDEQILRLDYVMLAIVHDFVFDNPTNRICFNPRASQHWYNRWASVKWNGIVNSNIRLLIEQALGRVKEDIIEQQHQTTTGLKPNAQQGSGCETDLKSQPAKDSIRAQVFICYSHRDKRWLNDLQTHLKPYVRNGLTACSDKQIVPGSKWLQEIETALASAKVAVLLVTPYFLASDFIHEKELGPLLKKAEKGKVRIIWIPIRACAYKETPLKDYQAAGNPDNPLANMKAERDKVWVKICEEIKKAVLDK